MEQVAVITGANSGVGFALARRLLAELACDIQLRLCLACRSLQKGGVAKNELLKEHPNANIDLLQVDTSDPQSCIEAGNEIKKRYGQGVRWLYCNAGIMPLKGTNWSALLSLKTRGDWVSLFTTGNGINKYGDWTMQSNGLQAVFATNVLGHYILIKELEDFLIDQAQPCHIIWTSSNSASTVQVDTQDIQCRNKDISYPHSKRLMDLVSLDINRRLNIHGIHSDTFCPGMVVSQMTLAIMPRFLWTMLLPIIFIIRLLVTHFITFHPSNGVEAMMCLSKQDPTTVDHSLKYFSRKPACGDTYVLKEKIPYTEVLLNNTMTSLNKACTPFLTKRK